MAARPYVKSHTSIRLYVTAFRGGLAPGGILGVRAHFLPETQQPKTSRPLSLGTWSKGQVYTRACRSSAGLYILLLLRKRQVAVSRMILLQGLARHLCGGLDGNIHVDLDLLSLDRGSLGVCFCCLTVALSCKIGGVESVCFKRHVICGCVYLFHARQLPKAEWVEMLNVNESCLGCM